MGSIKNFIQENASYKKITKEDFEKCVKNSITSVTVDQVRKCCAHSRRYMLDYTHLPISNITYNKIEHLSKLCKVHRNVSDQDQGYISKIWKESITVKEEYFTNSK